MVETVLQQMNAGKGFVMVDLFGDLMHKRCEDAVQSAVASFDKQISSWAEQMLAHMTEHLRKEVAKSQDQPAQVKSVLQAQLANVVANEKFVLPHSLLASEIDVCTRHALNDFDRHVPRFEGTARFREKLEVSNSLVDR